MYNVQRKPYRATLERHLNCDISGAQTHFGKSEGAKLEPYEEKQPPVYFQRATFFFFFWNQFGTESTVCLNNIQAQQLAQGIRVLTRGTLIGQEIK